MTQVEARVFIVDHHPIYRRGMATCLEGSPTVQLVGDCATPRDAWSHPGLLEADLVIVDPTGLQVLSFIRQLRDQLDVAIVACSPSCGEQDVLAVVEAVEETRQRLIFNVSEELALEALASRLLRLSR